MKVLKTNVGQYDGADVLLYELKADNGVTVKITNIGATITSIVVPDKDGKLGEVALGFDDPMVYLSEEYTGNTFFLGATIGRFGNRIGGGKFVLDGKEYQLECNDGVNHLHGGVNSFHTKMWKGEEFEAEGRVGVKMSYVSPNMENGYPGELSVSVVFTLNNNGELSLNYQAKTDKPTVVNLTNHSYFNLRGEGKVYDTRVLMHAANYTPRGEGNIPTGEVDSVKGTPLDFTLEHNIGERVHMFEDGYDHNFVIDGNQGGLKLAAEVYEPESGRTLQFSTTEPAFQFYTGFYLDGRYSRGLLKFEQFGGFCLEAQHYPDSPNKPSFPSTTLRPGETYTQTTVYKFGVK